MKWINVKDKLPKQSELVLVYEKDGRIIPAQLEYPEWGGELEFYAQLSQIKGLLHQQYPTSDVTHWMPLPKKPKEKK